MKKVFNIIRMILAFPLMITYSLIECINDNIIALAGGCIAGREVLIRFINKLDKVLYNNTGETIVYNTIANRRNAKELVDKFIEYSDKLNLGWERLSDTSLKTHGCIINIYNRSEVLHENK